jgi:probable rRNA maturation factor
MSHKVLIYADPDHKNVLHDLEKVAYTTLSVLDVPSGHLTLAFTDDDHIRELNREFAGVDQPTDVLSFPNNDTDLETGEMYYGDVVISIPYAERQAKEAGHPLRSELTLLIIHGVLHLFGFEHEEEEDRRKMWSVQDEILTQLGIEIVSPG